MKKVTHSSQRLLHTRMSPKTLFGTLCVLALILITSIGMFGQAATASSTLAGTVTDKTGAVVVGVTVTATDTATNNTRTATTNSLGSYRFEVLPPGIYSIKANMAGFSSPTAPRVELLVGRTTTQDFTLSPGVTSTTVEVTAAAPLLDQEKTSVGMEITPADVENLPLNGRDFSNLAYLAPGAKATAPWDPTKVRSAGVGINGSNGRNMNITVNGIDDKDNTVGGPVMQLPLEAVQEAVISTQRFSAANGRSEGAAMNVITRSGSNIFHGSGYFFDTQTALNANDYLNAHDAITGAATGNPTPQFERQQFGGRFGGPIVKDKDFGFFAWERLREHTAIPVTPSAFSQLSLVKGLNLGNVTFAPDPVQTIPTPYFDTRYNGRLDHTFSANHHFFVSYSAQSNNDVNDQSGNSNDLTEGNFQNNHLIVTNATLSSVFSPRLVNSFTAGYQYWNNLIDSKTRAPLVTFPQSISFGTNTNVPQQSYQRKYQFRDDLSYTLGTHGLKWGVDYLWEPSLGGYFEFNSTLEYDFQDLPSDILGNKGGLYPQGFQTPGAVTGMSISNGDPKEDLPGGGKMLGLYFQDTWKTTSRLTLDLGVRYDRDFNLMASDAQANSRTFQLLKSIKSPYAGVPQDYTKGFSPRVGFAYDLTGSGNNILRGGYGLYFAQTFLNIPLFMIQQTNPTLFATVFSISGSGPGSACTSCTVPGTNIPLSQYRLGIDPVPTIPAPITQLTAGAVGRLMAPDYRNPYSQQWNIGFAHSFDAKTVGEIEYIHELGLHEEKRQILNYVDPATGVRTLAPSITAYNTAHPTAPLPQIARISMETPWGRSRYDGMNVSLRRRMANHFTVNATYTLSRGLAYNGNAASYSNTVTDPRFPLLPSDFGPVPNDELHHGSVSAVVDLPWGLQVAPILQAASARPYDATTGFSNVLGFGSGPAAAHALVPTNDPGNILWGATQSSSALKACYLAGTCKESTFDSQRGQPYFNVDARLTKTIKIKERSDLKLIFQGFDLTNRANYGNNYDGNVRHFNSDPTKSSFATPLGYIGCNANGCNRAIPISFRAEFGAQFTF
jgi:outer membrane receptor protein involved in Fe transport